MEGCTNYLDFDLSDCEFDGKEKAYVLRKATDDYETWFYTNKTEELLYSPLILFGSSSTSIAQNLERRFIEEYDFLSHVEIIGCDKIVVYLKNPIVKFRTVDHAKQNIRVLKEMIESGITLYSTSSSYGYDVINYLHSEGVGTKMLGGNDYEIKYIGVLINLQKFPQKKAKPEVNKVTISTVWPMRYVRQDFQQVLYNILPNDMYIKTYNERYIKSKLSEKILFFADMIEKYLGVEKYRSVESFQTFCKSWVLYRKKKSFTKGLTKEFIHWMDKETGMGKEEQILIEEISNEIIENMSVNA